MGIKKFYFFQTAGYAIVVVPYYKHSGKILCVWSFIFINPNELKVLKQFNMYCNGLVL